MDQGTIELIARGVLRTPTGDILVCRNIGSDYWYLPGGHVEFGETAEEALRREVQEEGGIAVEKVQMIGVCEQLFTHAGKQRHEINIVFAGTVMSSEPITSREDHLEFSWNTPGIFATLRVLPQPLHTAVQTWLVDSQMFWISSSRK